MKNVASLSLIAALLLSAPARTFAGEQANETAEVTISANGWSASGSVGAARNSADKRQSIGCSVFADSSMNNPRIRCVAIDRDGRLAQCTSYSTKLLSVVQTINGDSWIAFTTSSDPVCITLEVHNNSRYMPKY